MIATLKFENIFFLDSDNFNLIFQLITLSIAITQFLSFIILIIFLNLGIFIESFEIIIYLILYTISLGFYYSFRAYHSSIGNFKVISLGYVIKVFLSNVLFLLLSIFFLPTYKILIIGTILSQLTESIILLINAKDMNFFTKFSFSNLYNFAVRYKNFPLFTLPGELLSTFNAQLPVFFLTNYYNSTVTGYYSIINRMFGIPLKLFTSSTAEAFRKEAAHNYFNYNSFKKLALKTSLILFLIALFGALFIYFTSDFLILLIFGKEWVNATDYLRVLIILFIFQFSISPISYGLYIAEKQKVDFFWQFFLVIICGLALFIGSTNYEAINTLLLFSLCYSLMYVIYFFLIIKFSEKNVK